SHRQMASPLWARPDSPLPWRILRRKYMAENGSNQKEIKRTIRLLREIESLADRASLTGSLQAGAGQAAQQVNSILRRLEQIGEVPEGFFPPLAADSNFDTIGVTAAQIAAYIHEEEEEAEKGHPSSSGGVHINVNGPIGNLADLDQLRELGK